jgi:hypothetical protein
MSMRSHHLTIARHGALRIVAGSTACALVLLCAAQASGQSAHATAQSGQPGGAPVAGAPAATLEQCVTAGAQAERSATFSGEMTAIAGAVRMSMRIDVEERRPAEAQYHAVSAPGLGVWRASEPKVKVYKYLKEVTNLSSPASYRALVRFRWLGAKGHLLRRAERLTARCVQPAPPSEATAPSTATPTPSATALSVGA